MAHPNPWEPLLDMPGVTASLQRSVARLVGALHEVTPEPVARVLARVHEALSRPDGLDRAARLLEASSDEEIEAMIRFQTTLFHLLNQAEKQEIIRVNRERAIAAGESDGRPESIAATARALAADGLGANAFGLFLERLDIGPTLTAHPTEARRRSVLSKQKAIGEAIAALEGRALTPAEATEAEHRMRRAVHLLIATDEVRSRDVTVQDEVEYGLHFLAGTIWDVLPRIAHDLRDAARRHFGFTPGILAPLRFRSWIGGDRDGNPNVTPEVTRETAARLRAAAIDLNLAALAELRRILSISEDRVVVSEALARSLRQDLEEVDPGEMARRHYAAEPFRLKIACMEARLRAERAGDAVRAYDAGRYREDLDLLADALGAAGLDVSVQTGPLAALRDRVAATGLHLAALDIRQHSARHEEAVAEILSVAGVEAEYAFLPEADRLRLLERELGQPRPLLPRGATLSPGPQSVVRTFDVIRELVSAEPESVGSVIVSMTHAASDLLEVLLLAKEAGLWDGAGCPLDVVPLFETVDDLERADGLMADLFGNAPYGRHLEGRGRFQEIMLGYSDSNKDGGFWMANWALHGAQARLVGVCRAHQVDFRLFHGRGGTVGRGGGRANRAIASMPAATAGGRIRFTEQGEVISFRYAQQELAHRHLEQIVSAVLSAQAAAREDGDALATGEWAGVMDQIARSAMDAYRALISDEGFWSFYTSSTPIAHISRLPIASRPVSRKKADEVDFEGLRAIPWVFAWTQTRHGVPGWYGTGAGLDAATGGFGLDTLRAMYVGWPFFAAVIDNLQLEMVRARASIAARYAALGGAEAVRLHDRIESDLRRAREAVLSITGQDELLDSAPAVQASVRYRDPHTDALNLMQVELMRRARAERDAGRRERLHELLHRSINGVAAAMQSTG